MFFSFLGGKFVRLHCEILKILLLLPNPIGGKCFNCHREDPHHRGGRHPLSAQEGSRSLLLLQEVTKALSGEKNRHRPIPLHREILRLS